MLKVLKKYSANPSRRGFRYFSGGLPLLKRLRGHNVQTRPAQEKLLCVPAEEAGQSRKSLLRERTLSRPLESSLEEHPIDQWKN